MLACVLAAAAVAPVAPMSADVHPSADDMLLPTRSGLDVYFVIRPPSSAAELWKSDGRVSSHPIAALQDFADFTEMIAFRGGVALIETVPPSAEAWLWLSDGTSATTSKLTPDTWKTAARGLAGGDALYFMADDGVHGDSLWRTDGSAAPVLVSTPPASDSCWGQPLFAAGGGVLFAQHVSGRGACTLSRADASGVTPLVDLAEAPHDATAVGDEVYFFAAGRVWVTDGTAAGTRALSLPANAAPIGADATSLWFSQPGSGGGFDLCRTFGDDASTAVIQLSFTAIGAGAGVAGGKFVFAASDATHPLQLWVSEGNSTNTAPLGALPAGLGFDWQYPAFLGAGDVFYVLTDGNEKTVWATDGTAAGTTAIGAMAVPVAGVTMNRLVPFGPGAAFIHHNQPDYDFLDLDLVYSDGTAAGTQPLGGQPVSSPAELNVMGAAGSSLYFLGVGQGATSRSMWKTDGVSTVPVSGDGFDCSGCFIGDSAASGQTLLFMFGSHQLWRTDGFDTSLVHDFSPKDAEALTPLGGAVFFLVTDATTAEVWKSDSTSAGTVKVAQAAPPFYDQLAVWNGAVWFPGVDPAGAPALWKTDGTAAGTALVATVAPAGAGSPPSSFIPAHSRLYFLAGDGVHGRELWKTDGTASGTAMVADVNPGPDGIDFFPDQQAAVVGDELFFSPDQRPGSTAPAALFKSDGTAAGTAQVVPVGMTWPSMTAFGGGVLFFGADAASGFQLWRADATGGAPLTALPHAVYHAVGVDGAFSPHLAAGGLFFFAARDDVSGQEPWVSDGTAAGTQRLADLAQGLRSSSPRDFTLAGSNVFFTADDHVHGRQLYVTPVTVAPGGSGNPAGGSRGGCSSSSCGWACALALLTFARRRVRLDARSRPA